MKLRVTLSKTIGGDQDYLQVLSDDVTSVNVVLVADTIEVSDSRPGRSEQRHRPEDRRALIRRADDPDPPSDRRAKKPRGPLARETRGKDRA